MQQSRIEFRRGGRINKEMIVYEKYKKTWEQCAEDNVTPVFFLWLDFLALLQLYAVDFSNVDLSAAVGTPIKLRLDTHNVCKSDFSTACAAIDVACHKKVLT